GVGPPRPLPRRLTPAAAPAARVAPIGAARPGRSRNHAGTGNSAGDTRPPLAVPLRRCRPQRAGTRGPLRAALDGRPAALDGRALRALAAAGRPRRPVAQGGAGPEERLAVREGSGLLPGAVRRRR